MLLMTKKMWKRKVEGERKWKGKGYGRGKKSIR